jgi:hypothetical protein
MCGRTKNANFNVISEISFTVKTQYQINGSELFPGEYTVGKGLERGTIWYRTQSSLEKGKISKVVKTEFA